MQRERLGNNSSSILGKLQMRVSIDGILFEVISYDKRIIHFEITKRHASSYLELLNWAQGGRLVPFQCDAFAAVIYLCEVVSYKSAASRGIYEAKIRYRVKH